MIWTIDQSDTRLPTGYMALRIALRPVEATTPVFYKEPYLTLPSCG